MRACVPADEVLDLGDYRWSASAELMWGAGVVEEVRGCGGCGG